MSEENVLGLLRKLDSKIESMCSEMRDNFHTLTARVESIEEHLGIKQKSRVNLASSTTRTDSKRIQQDGLEKQQSSLVNREDDVGFSSTNYPRSRRGPEV